MRLIIVDPLLRHPARPLVIPSRAQVTSAEAFFGLEIEISKTKESNGSIAYNRFVERRTTLTQGGRDRSERRDGRQTRIVNHFVT